MKTSIKEIQSKVKNNPMTYPELLMAFGATNVDFQELKKAVNDGILKTAYNEDANKVYFL